MKFKKMNLGMKLAKFADKANAADVRAAKKDIVPVKKKVSKKSRDQMNDLAYHYLNNIAAWVMKNKKKIEDAVLKKRNATGFMLLSKHMNAHASNVAGVFNSVAKEYPDLTISLFTTKGFRLRNYHVLLTANDKFGDLIYTWVFIVSESEKLIIYVTVYESEKLNETKITSTDKLENLYESRKIY